MIKKVFACGFVSIFICTALCGCRGFKDEEKPNDKRLVSAVGFDAAGQSIRMTLEAVEAVGDGRTELHILSANADLPEKALSKIRSDSLGELSFVHCGVILIGKSLSEGQITKITDLLSEGEEFPLSARMVAADNAEELLNSSKDGDTAAGFRLLELVEQKHKVQGIGGHSALYEIKTAMLQPIRVYALPEARLSGGRFKISGLCVFKGETVSRLEDDDAVSYAVLRNVFDGGEVPSEEEICKADKTKTYINASLEGDVLNLKITVSSKNGADLLADNVFKTLSNIKRDVFGIDAAIYRNNRQVWESIKDDYPNVFQNAVVTVNSEDL